MLGSNQRITISKTVAFTCLANPQMFFLVLIAGFEPTTSFLPRKLNYHCDISAIIFGATSRIRTYTFGMILVQGCGIEPHSTVLQTVAELPN
jgi:hypothetical protein